jgi:hypothetical protein
MTEYKIGNATVRIHGSMNQDTVRAATERFVKKAIQQKKKKEKENVHK